MTTGWFYPSEVLILGLRKVRVEKTNAWRAPKWWAFPSKRCSWWELLVSGRVNVQNKHLADLFVCVYFLGGLGCWVTQYFRAIRPKSFPLESTLPQCYLWQNPSKRKVEDSSWTVFHLLYHCLSEKTQGSRKSPMGWPTKHWGSRGPGQKVRWKYISI